MRTSTRSYIVLLLLVGFVIFYTYLRLVPAPCYEFCGDLHRQIVAQTADSPYRYRLLSALIVQPFVGDGSDKGIAGGYGLAHLFALPAMLIALFAWLRTWGSDNAALVGTLVLALLLPMMLETWGISLYSALEVILLCAALVVLKQRPRRFTLVFAALTLTASLNRETGLLLPLAFLAWDAPHWRTAGYWRRGLLFVLCWLVPYAGLRLWLGAAPDVITVAQTWVNNTGGGWVTQEAMFKNAFLLPLYALTLYGLHRAPKPLLRLMPVALVYLALMLAFGQWNEVRLQAPLLVFALPVVVRKL